MPQLATPPAVQNRTAPDFSLVALDGRRFRRSMFRERGRPVLAFVHPACQDCPALLDALAREAEALARFDARILILLATDNAAEAAAWGERPFPLLLDANRAVRTRYETFLSLPPAVESALVVLLDEFGAVRAAYQVQPDEPPSRLLAFLLDELRALYYDCPE